MTTNKPGVVAVMYRDGAVLTKQECGIAFDTCCKVETPLIRLSDYEALAAECESLKVAAKYSEAVDATPENQRETILYDTLRERDALQAECEMMRRDVGGLVESLEECVGWLEWMYHPQTSDKVDKARIQRANRALAPFRSKEPK